MENCYKQLQVYIEESDYPQILTMCDTILQQDPSQNEAKICKLVAYMHMEQYQAANNLLAQSEALVKSDPYAAYTRVYSTYQSQKYKDCIDQIGKYKKVFPQDVRFDILLGQTQYKLKNYEQSAEIFVNIIEQNPDHEDVQDIFVNTLNIGILLQNQSILNKILIKIDRNKDFSRELLFNLSLAYSMLDNYTKAQEYLEFFQKDIIQEESDISQMNMTQFGDYILGQIQQDFLQNKSLDFQDKIETYQNYLQDNRLCDKNMKSVLQHNLTSMKQNTSNDQNYSESMKYLTDISSNPSLLCYQQQEVLFNKLLIILSRNKTQDALKLLNELQQRFPHLFTEKRAQQAQGYLMMSQKQPFEKITTIISEDSIENLFILSELARIQKNTQKSVEFLTKIIEKQPSYLDNINMVSYIISKLDNLPIPPVIQQLAQNQNHQILHLYADFLHKRQEFSQAAIIYEKLYSMDSKNPQISGSFVNCLQKLGQTEKVSQILESQPLPEIIFDAQVLQQQFILKLKDFLIRIIQFIRQLESNLEFSKANKDSKVEVQKTRKIKKRTRYPKGFDPANPGPLPDPERWLPKYMRKKFKGLLKKQTRNQGVDVSNKETVQNFKNKASTANQDVSKNALKKKKKK